MLRPICPAFLIGLEGIETCTIEVGESITVYPLTELPAEVLTGIVNASGSSQSGSCANQDTVSIGDLLFKPLNTLREAAGRCHGLCRGKH